MLNLLLVLRSASEARVSKDEARLALAALASWFESAGYAGLLIMRSQFALEMP